VNEVGWIGPLHTAVEAFGILPKDGHVDLWLLNAVTGSPPNKIQGVALIGPAGPDTNIQVKVLPEPDNGA
jgi:hypothetical protein